MWTGRQGLQRGLVDVIGGLPTALQIAASMSDISFSSTTSTLPVQTLAEPQSGFPLPFPFASRASSMDGIDQNIDSEVLALCDSSVSIMGLASDEALGLSPFLSKLGLPLPVSFALASNKGFRTLFQLMANLEESRQNAGQQLFQIFSQYISALVDEWF